MMLIKSFNQNMWVMGTIITFLVLWTLIWKGFALWTSARKGSKAWFILLLIINTFGILEIIYIYLIAKKSEENEKLME